MGKLYEARIVKLFVVIPQKDQRGHDFKVVGAEFVHSLTRLEVLDTREESFARAMRELLTPCFPCGIE